MLFYARQGLNKRPICRQRTRPPACRFQSSLPLVTFQFRNNLSGGFESNSTLAVWERADHSGEAGNLTRARGAPKNGRAKLFEASFEPQPELRPVSHPRGLGLELLLGLIDL